MYMLLATAFNLCNIAADCVHLVTEGTMIYFIMFFFVISFSKLIIWSISLPEGISRIVIAAIQLSTHT
jgi:hypothetical protein